MMCEEKYYKEWYIDSSCSCHMTRRKGHLKDYTEISEAGNVKFGNNKRATNKGYRKFTNGNFEITRVTYIEGLKHNLTSVSQICVGTNNKFTFDERGSIFKNKRTKEIWLK